MIFSLQFPLEVNISHIIPANLRNNYINQSIKEAPRKLE